MWTLKNLGGYLSEVYDLCFAALFIDLVFLILKAVAIILIGEVVVDVEVVDGFFSFLSLPEDEIDPSRHLA